ncbi:DNA-binding PucR family transcriptional regulator [Branchiibius hedensis]|uniref:PucR C-terminal helix-turn-helix domain-containing protein n=1 Tax=Branchiibius hedensis TaxID=672460 RepID=A0A2Y9C1D3_9MICO|nr:helix-turn-helix domain-containing protein [Branchiibius hedensis]PWJ25319.1 DNA-binding PucR family transcriptional regulator [Branchiibius hedensis]SSA34133.1 PucR C-terminal helix-turn-helix domain-containing protein [Branchiibius hedensis]
MKTAIEESDRDILAAVSEALESASDQLVQRQLDALTAIASYRRVPTSALRRSCARNVVRVAQTLRGIDHLPPSIEEDEHRSGRDRALQGLPAEDVIAAYRLVMAVLRDAFLDVAQRQELPFDTVLRGTRGLWETTDALSNELVAARRQMDAELTRREEQERLTFLHRVLEGGLTGVDLAQVGCSFGLMPDQDYWVIRCRTDTATAPRVLRLLEQTTHHPTVRPLLGPLDGDIAGVLTAPPDRRTDLMGAVVAVSGAASLTGLHTAFQDATRLLSIAVRFARTGVVDQSDLSIRIAVAQESELGDALLDKYVRPVLAGSTDGPALLESIRMYLRHDRNVCSCASALVIHQNTLRNRLEKFELLTESNLRSTETIFETWWALEYWQLQREGNDPVLSHHATVEARRSRCAAPLAESRFADR